MLCLEVQNVAVNYLIYSLIAQYCFARGRGMGGVNGHCNGSLTNSVHPNDEESHDYMIWVVQFLKSSYNS